MKKRGGIFCAGLLFLAGLAAALAQEEGVILRYKYKPGQEVIYEYRQINITEMRKGEETQTHEERTKGKVGNFALSVSDEGVIEMASYQDQNVLMYKVEGEEQPLGDEVWPGLFWHKFNERGQAVMEKESRFVCDYFEQMEIIELPEGPIDVGGTWKTGTEEDRCTYEVLAREKIGQNECFRIKGVRRVSLAQDDLSLIYKIPFSESSGEIDVLFWFAIDKGYIPKVRATTTSELIAAQEDITLSGKSLYTLTLVEEKSFDEAEISSRRKQLEKLYAIQDAIDAQEFGQAESDIEAFNKVFPDSPYKEVAENCKLLIQAIR